MNSLQCSSDKSIPRLTLTRSNLVMNVTMISRGRDTSVTRSAALWGIQHSSRSHLRLECFLEVSLTFRWTAIAFLVL